jgi:hypothetical protein
MPDDVPHGLPVPASAPGHAPPQTGRSPRCGPGRGCGGAPSAVIAALILGVSGCSAVAIRPATAPGVLFAEDFERHADGVLPEGWWVEGGEAVYVEDGAMVIRCDPEVERGPGHVCTVWNETIFAGDVRVDFDARVLASSIDANNINFFLHYSHPAPGTGLRGSANHRLDGMYTHYHDLNGYIFTFLHAGRPGSDAARFRLRRTPGFELIAESYGHHSRVGTTYHVTITKRGRTLTLAVDGEELLRADDELYDWRSGLIGVRTFHTDLRIDNLRVIRLTEIGATP